MLRRVVSGGQTGVDRAALDAAAAVGLARGGWCPRGRAAEDGPIDPGYPLRETPEADPAQRTAWNVRDSDATLILARGPLRGGTALTAECARAEGRPLRVVRPGEGPDPAETLAWLRAEGVETLNVAGPRESQAPGIGAEAQAWLEALLARAAEGPPLPEGKAWP